MSDATAVFDAPGAPDGPDGSDRSRGSGSSGPSDGWFRREAASAVPRSRRDEPRAERPGGRRPDAGLSGGRPPDGDPLGGGNRGSDDQAATRIGTGRMAWGVTGAAGPVRSAGSTASSGAGSPPGFAGGTRNSAADPAGSSGAAADDSPGFPGGSAAGSSGSTGSLVDPGAGRDSWHESEHTHDPHEVTVQLDAVGRQTEDWLVQQAKGAPSAGEASDRPVFVDETGRRSRRYRRIGMAVGLACAVYAMVILATLMSGNSSAPWLPELGQKDEAPAGKVEIPPLTAESEEPSGEASPTAGTTPSADTPPSQFPGAGVSPVPSASATAPEQSADPAPSADSTKPAPPKPTKSDTPAPVTSSPDVPEPTDTGASPDPSDLPASGGTDTVAGEPLTPGPMPLPPGPTTAPSSSSSPENVL